MTCQSFRRQIHVFLDGELPPRHTKLLEDHLKGCVVCRRHHWELLRMREGLRPRRLSQARQEWLWARIQTRLRPKRVARKPFPIKTLSGLLREFGTRKVASGLAAVPITLCLFLTVLVQFEPTLFREWTSPSQVIALSSSGPPLLPVVQQIQVRYPRAKIQDLMSAVRRIPFEDSLSLVAEITPEGHAQIDNILQYPRSHELLSAVDLTLRGSAFEQAYSKTRGQPFVIYSLQKVDVFADYEGL